MKLIHGSLGNSMSNKNNNRKMRKIGAILIALVLWTFFACSEDEVAITQPEKNVAIENNASKQDSTSIDSVKANADSLKADSLKTDSIKTDSIKTDSVSTDSANRITGTVYYLAPTGNDATGNGTAAKPWKTLKYAVTKAQAGYTIHLASGTYTEDGLIQVPVGVSIEGVDRANTIIKAASSFYYHPSNPEYAPEKFLISLSSSTLENGNQSLKNFTIDGDAKQLHGGIYVRNRSNVTLDGMKVQYTNFTGLWLWDVANSKVNNTQLFNCSWGSSSYCAGALNLGNINQVEISQLEVNENTGYGIKAIGPNGYNTITNLKIHDSHVSVNAYGIWNSGTAPNIAIELWKVILKGSEIYNTYVDNTISLVNSDNSVTATGVQGIRVHHNTIDMETRAKGAGYGLELTIHDAEVDHNYFIKGTQGIANWDNAKQNWNIHHNVFYAIQGEWPGEILRSQNSGLHSVKFYNNTIEFAGNKTVNLIGVYGGSSDNLDIRNNLLVNSNTSYSFYPTSFIHTENGASLSNVKVKNNFLNNMDLGSVSGVTYGGNLNGDPKIKKSGARPTAYYTPVTGSPLINTGLSIITNLTNSSTNIGAY
jgi:hypothetical protein